MNRRDINKALAVCLAIAAITSCATKGTGDKRSVESVSSVMFTVDQKSLVVVTPKYHYFLDMSGPLRASIQGSFHRYVRASFSEFSVDPNNKLYGSVHLILVNDAPPEAVQAAINAGFRQLPSHVAASFAVYGNRFKANGTHFSDEYKLNKTYGISVLAHGDPTPQMSPVTEFAGEVTIYGILLVVAPQVLFSK